MSKKKSPVTSHQSPAEELKKQIAELTEALKRERADSDNIRRRHEGQLVSLKGMVKSNAVRELLPVIDNFERALRHVPSMSQESRVKSQEEKQLFDWIEGVKQILVQFEKTLEKMGVERIKTVGEVFDPRFHEAVSMEDGAGTQEIVAEELQAGYKLNDEIIRHAMVRVKMQ